MPVEGQTPTGLAIVFAIAVLASPSVVSAQDGAPGALVLDLNRADQVGEACRLTFVAENRLDGEIATLTLETVLIDDAGVVDRLTMFEFGQLPANVPRVRQFDVPGLDCAVLGRVLINGVAECGGREDCSAALELTSRTDIELLG